MKVFQNNNLFLKSKPGFCEGSCFLINMNMILKIGENVNRQPDKE